LHSRRFEIRRTFGSRRKITNCFENVKISAKLYQVFWGGIEILLATLACMRTLLKMNPDWKYFIDLSGQDFPLKTQKEIVEFLKNLKNQNHVEIVEENFKNHYKFHHEIVRDSIGFPLEMRRTSIKKSAPPNNLTIFKGNVAAILHRNFCDWLQNSDEALEFLGWLHDVKNPDEHYWATLLGNKQLKGPGGAKNPENFFGRFAIWKPNKKCRGKFVHDVCIFGAEDVQNLLGLPHLFVNKFYYEFETPAFECTERWLANK